MTDKGLSLINKMRDKKTREFWYGIRNLHDMRMFVNGYMENESERHPEDTENIFGGFLQFQEREFCDTAERNMTHYEFVRHHSSNDDESFDKFFSLLDEFLQLPKYKKSVPYDIMCRLTMSPGMTLANIREIFEINVSTWYSLYHDFIKYVHDVYCADDLIPWDIVILENTKNNQNPKDVFMSLFEEYLHQHEDTIEYY